MKKVAPLAMIFLLTISTLLMFGQEVWAQYGSISGQVTDCLTGLPASYAQVEVWDSQWENLIDFTTADASGYYAFSNIPASENPLDDYYIVVAYHEDFGWMDWRAPVLAGASLTLNFRLSIGLENAVCGVYPPVFAIAPGELGTFTTYLTAKTGWFYNLTLSIYGLPSGWSYSFDPTFLAYYGESTLEIVPSPDAPEGIYPIGVIFQGTEPTPSNYCNTLGVTLIISSPSLEQPPSQPLYLQAESRFSGVRLTWQEPSDPGS
jgi:hypothetical protein